MTSDIWATPHEAEETVEAGALALPTEDNVVLADEDVEGDSEPLGIGEPEAHVAELVLTVPPEPVPVE
ncbi:MAG TPA: hypothetical protein VEJ84_20820 [Acidimicrobiales bacterium]|nr:hypothetical protein [Acidimicrobiales bacterium]